MNSSKNIVAVAVAAGVVIVAAWFLLLYQPTTKQVDTIRAEIDTTTQKQAELKTQLAGLKKMAANKGDIEAGMARMNEAVPASPELTEFIRQANQAASANGVDWLSVSPSEPGPAEGGLQVVTLQLQVAGTYDHLVNYLQALLGTLPDAAGKPYVTRVFTVDTFNVSGGTSAGTNTGPSPVLNAQITGRIFVQPKAAAAVPGAAAGAAPAPAPAAK